MGPKQEASKYEHANKYRMPNETYEGYVNRLTNVLGDTADHKMKMKSYLGDMSILPAGRIQRAIGSNLEVTGMNCLRGDTEVVTSQGVKKIESILDEMVIVYGPNNEPLNTKFIKTGVKEEYELVVTKGKRIFHVFTTENHKWPTVDIPLNYDEMLTSSDLNLKNRITQSKIDRENLNEDEYHDGIIHGLIYGDGYYNGKGYIYRVCSDIEEISEYLEGIPFSNSPSCNGDPTYYFYGENITADFKSLPVNVSDSYLLGFFDGWFAADGCISNQPEVTICMDDTEEEWCKQYGPIVNWIPIGSSYLSKETNYGIRNKSSKNVRFDRGFLSESNFIISRKRNRFKKPVLSSNSFKVKSVKKTGCMIDTYCCEVEGHQFKLASGMMSGNCFVSGTIQDSSEDIFEKVKEAFMTMRMGGGIGYDFSTLRPRHALINSLQSGSSGPISFMNIFDSTCHTVRSAGGRRGAQMGVLRVDHPDIVEFITAKTNSDKLTNFNISVAITDKFIEAVKNNSSFDLVFNGQVYETVDAGWLWNLIMETNWDWAEPGILFVDRANEMNNLWYCEDFAATNPCGEQWLPPYGACLLGSTNLTQFVTLDRKFNFERYKEATKTFTRALDNVFDNTNYPLDAQREEALMKRRMGIGLTGVANTIEYITDSKYASDNYIELQDQIMKLHTYTIYEESINLAREKGPFPAFDRDKYLQSKFIQTLPDYIQQGIYDHGIRNSHSTSFAPTGTISLTADNPSSGLECMFAKRQRRTIINDDNITKREVLLEDYASKYWDFDCTPASEVTPSEHVRVLNHAQKYIDSSCSKTCNIGSDTTFEQFKQVYMDAYDGGAKGCTTFRIDGKRFGILKSVPDVPKTEQACEIDEFGQKSCGQV